MRTTKPYILLACVLLGGLIFGCDSDEEAAPVIGQRIHITELYGDKKERGVSIEATLVASESTGEVVLEQINVTATPPSEAASGKLEAVLSDAAFKRTEGDWPLSVARMSPEAAPFVHRIQIAAALLDDRPGAHPSRRRLTSGNLFGKAPSVAVTEIVHDGEQIQIQSMGLVSTNGASVVSLSKVGGEAQDGALKLSGNRMRLGGQTSESIWMTVSTSRVADGPDR